MATTQKKKEYIITAIPEVDEKLGGGIPLGSLCLVEGHSDSGKSVLCQHLTNGTLITGEISVAYYTTENNIRSLISQMESLAMNVLDHFLADHLRIYPLTFRSNIQGGQKPFYVLNHHFSRLPKEYKLIIVDSITLLIAHSNPVAIIDFFSRCKDLCDEGRTIIVVAHSYAFPDPLAMRCPLQAPPGAGGGQHDKDHGSPQGTRRRAADRRCRQLRYRTQARHEDNPAGQSQSLGD
jgi:flagellar protein FlaH